MLDAGIDSTATRAAVEMQLIFDRGQCERCPLM